MKLTGRQTNTCTDRSVILYMMREPKKMRGWRKMASPITSTPPTPEEDEEDGGNLPVSVGPDHHIYSFLFDHHSLLTEDVFAPSWSAFSLDYNQASHHENPSCLRQLLQWSVLKCGCCWTSI